MNIWTKNNLFIREEDVTKKNNCTVFVQTTKNHEKPDNVRSQKCRTALFRENASGRNEFVYFKPHVVDPSKSNGSSSSPWAMSYCWGPEENGQRCICLLFSSKAAEAPSRAATALATRFKKAAEWGSHAAVVSATRGVNWTPWERHISAVC